MDDVATTQDIARRTSSAVDAAVGSARDLGLTVTDAVVLHDLFSVVVRLDPAPVVARVPTVLPGSTDLDALAARQRSELDVTAWLADRGTPVLRPSPLVPPEPVRRDGFSMTFWEYVEEAAGAEPDYVANAGRVPELHAAMRGYPGPLTFLSSAEPAWVGASLDRLGAFLPAPDVDRARREWTVLEPLVRSRAAFAQRFPGAGLQPVHGDSPAANVFDGADGSRFADFELVTLGPVEWDMATLGPEFEAAYDRGAERTGVRTLDRDVLDFVGAVGMLRALSTLTLIPQLPVLAEYLMPAVEQWRSGPGPAGVDVPGRGGGAHGVRPVAEPVVDELDRPAR